MAFCRGCAKEIGDTVATCTQCGAPQLVQSTAGVSASQASAKVNWYFEVLKKYAVFTGRARRKEYWMFILFNFLVAVVIGAVEGLMGGKGMISNIYTLAVFLPSIAVGVRRLHDTDRSGWWLLLPVVNIIFLMLEGNSNTNRFGPSPK